MINDFMDPGRIGYVTLAIDFLPSNQTWIVLVGRRMCVVSERALKQTAGDDVTPVYIIHVAANFRLGLALDHNLLGVTHHDLY